MLNMDLLPRPFSCHMPKVAGYEPLIKAEVVRVNRRRKNSWRCQVLVGDAAMCTSHHDTKYAAESNAAGMLETYTNIHYQSK